MFDWAVNSFIDYIKMNKISMKLNTTRLFNKVKQDNIGKHYLLKIIDSTIIET